MEESTLLLVARVSNIIFLVPQHATLVCQCKEAAAFTPTRQQPARGWGTSVAFHALSPALHALSPARGWVLLAVRGWVLLAVSASLIEAPAPSFIVL